MNIRRIIVTGASGPIGVMMIKKCIECNIKVVAVVRPNSKKLSDIPIHPLITVYEKDIIDIDNLGIDLTEPVDAFFHFAWMYTGDERRDDPILQEKNITVALKAAELASKIGCKVFVGTGSQAEYGIVDGMIDEDTPTDPVTMYGVTKLAAGKLVMEYCRTHDIRCNWVRIFSVFGPYENDYILMSYLIRTLLKGEEPVLTPCEQIWDLLYCKDAVNALMMIARKAPSSGVYCLGSGQAKPLKEYVTAVRDAINLNLSTGIGKRAYSDNQIMHLEADISKLRHDVGFEPEYTFDDGLKETIEWYRERKS